MNDTRVRLTAKQRDFIRACDGRYQDGYTADGKPKIVAMPYCFGLLQWDEWGFWNRSNAERFVDRLVRRGLIRTDKEPFYWATDAGRAAAEVGKTVEGEKARRAVNTEAMFAPNSSDDHPEWNEEPKP